MTLRLVCCSPPLLPSLHHRLHLTATKKKAAAIVCLLLRLISYLCPFGRLPDADAVARPCFPTMFVAVLPDLFHSPSSLRSALARSLERQHFHYGYVVHAAAIIGHLRPAWLTTTNVNWVNTLLRDTNSPDKVGTVMLNTQNRPPRYAPSERLISGCGKVWRRAYTTQAVRSVNRD